MRGAFLAIVCAGCFQAAPYRCQADGDCGLEGSCESTGYCSFPDGICPSGARYGEHADPLLASQCVGGGREDPSRSDGGVDSSPLTNGPDADPDRPEACGSSVVVFEDSTAPQDFVVTACEAITIKAWGGGGGGGNGDATGGGAAFMKIERPLSQGSTLTVWVAGGGTVSTHPTYGASSGGGGGASTVTLSGDVVLVVGGGGGAAADGCAAGSTCLPGNLSVASGGAAGSAGQAGDAGDCDASIRGGDGGRGDAGGLGGVGASSGGHLTGGSSGGTMGMARGGDGPAGGASDAVFGAGGGGGSGWWGGGGGGYRPGSCGAGGGGGSSYSAPDNPNTLIVSGTGREPGRASDVDHANDAGRGGGPGQAGRPGRVVIRY